MEKKNKKQEVKIKMFNNYNGEITFDDLKIENVKKVNVEAIREEFINPKNFISRIVTTGYELTLQVFVPVEQMEIIKFIKRQ